MRLVGAANEMAISTRCPRAHVRHGTRYNDAAWLRLRHSWRGPESLGTMTYALRILRVPDDAPLAEIQEAFHSLSLRCHPDRFVDDGPEVAGGGSGRLQAGGGGLAQRPASAKPQFRQRYDNELHRQGSGQPPAGGGPIRRAQGRDEEAARAAHPLHDRARTPKAEAVRSPRRRDPREGPISKGPHPAHQRDPERSRQRRAEGSASGSSTKRSCSSRAASDRPPLPPAPPAPAARCLQCRSDVGLANVVEDARPVAELSAVVHRARARVPA